MFQTSSFAFFMRSFMSLGTVLFVSSPALAVLTGSWTGWGSWAFQSESNQVKCPLMQMSWVESSSSLVLAKGLYDCDVVRMEIDPQSWIRRGNQLLDSQGQQVGTYNGRNLQLLVADPSQATQIEVVLRQDGEHFDYREIWFHNWEKLYIIKGRLFRKSSR